MPAEILIVEAKHRPIAAVAVTTVLSKWPRQFRHSLDQVYAAVRAGHVRAERPKCNGLSPPAKTAAWISNVASRLRRSLIRLVKLFTARHLPVGQQRQRT